MYTDEILVIAKNTMTQDEISKSYNYNQIYSYYKLIPEFEEVESDVDNVIKIVSKKILIGDYSKTGKLEIRLKKISTTNVRRDSTPMPINFTGNFKTKRCSAIAPMNIIREEEKSSQNI